MGLRKQERHGQGKAELQRPAHESHMSENRHNQRISAWPMPTVGHREGVLLRHLPQSLSKGLPVDFLLLESHRDELG